jgi:hypothetical protein
MTFVLVNLIYHPTSGLAEHDQKLAELSMAKLQKYFDFKGLEKFKQLRHVLVQIENMAKSVIEDAQKSPPEATAQPKYAFNSAYLPSVPPPVDIFDISFGQDSVSIY